MSSAHVLYGRGDQASGTGSMWRPCPRPAPFRQAESRGSARQSQSPSPERQGRLSQGCGHPTTTMHDDACALRPSSPLLSSRRLHRVCQLAWGDGGALRDGNASARETRQDTRPDFAVKESVKRITSATTEGAAEMRGRRGTGSAGRRPLTFSGSAGYRTRRGAGTVGALAMVALAAAACGNPGPTSPSSTPPPATHHVATATRHYFTGIGRPLLEALSVATHLKSTTPASTCASDETNLSDAVARAGSQTGLDSTLVELLTDEMATTQRVLAACAATKPTRSLLARLAPIRSAVRARLFEDGVHS